MLVELHKRCRGDCYTLTLRPKVSGKSITCVQRSLLHK
jgi:hypothetical protein